MRTVVVLTAVLLTGTAAGARTAADPIPTGTTASDPAWRVSVRPYLFFAGVSGSITLDPVTIPINSSFGDLLDNLKAGGFIGFRAERGQWGGSADFQFIRLVGEGASERDFASLTLDNLFLEVDGTFQPTGFPSLRFLAGLRGYSIDQSVSLRNGGPHEASTTVLDPILGALGEWDLGNIVDFEMRGDIGGFGVTSEFTYQLQLLVNFGLNRTFDIPFGYRVLGYQIKADDIWMNTRMGGLVLGLAVRF